MTATPLQDNEQPSAPTPGEITQLLSAASAGDRLAHDRVFELVYHELRSRARRLLGRMPGTQTLATTALVHEAYLRLARFDGAPPRDRGHFFAVAAMAMRQIVVDHARRRLAQKRGLGVAPDLLDEAKIGRANRHEEVLAVDQALGRLEALDPRLARLVELRFFAGLSVEEAAEALEVSDRTLRRDWRKACALLMHELSPAQP